MQDKVNRINSVFTDCQRRNKGTKLTEPNARQSDAYQREYLDRMTKLECANITRKQYHHTTLYPLPKSMGRSVYNSLFDKTPHIKAKKVNYITMEKEYQKMFTDLTGKNNFKAEDKSTAVRTYNVINEQLEKMKTMNSYSPENNKTMHLNNIYNQTKPTVKVYESDNREIQLDKDLNKIGQASKYSVYGNDFQNWGKGGKLVLKRPEEKINSVKLRGESHFTID